MKNKREIIQNAKNKAFEIIKEASFDSNISFDDVDEIESMINAIKVDDILDKIEIDMDDDIDMDAINKDVLNYIINYIEECIYDGSFDFVYYYKAMEWLADNKCYDFTDVMELGYTDVAFIATYYKTEMIRELLYKIEV